MLSQLDFFFLYHLDMISHNTTEYGEATESDSWPLLKIVFDDAPSTDDIWAEMIKTIKTISLMKVWIVRIFKVGG